MRKFFGLRQLLVVLAVVLAGLVAMPNPAQAAWKRSGLFKTKSVCQTHGIDAVRLHPKITNYKCVYTLNADLKFIGYTLYLNWV